MEEEDDDDEEASAAEGRRYDELRGDGGMPARVRATYWRYLTAKRARYLATSTTRASFARVFLAVRVVARCAQAQTAGQSARLRTAAMSSDADWRDTWSATMLKMFGRFVAASIASASRRRTCKEWEKGKGWWLGNERLHPP
jgi:hypothetical protein